MQEHDELASGPLVLVCSEGLGAGNHTLANCKE
jgi:hypothetical protein